MAPEMNPTLGCLVICSYLFYFVSTVKYWELDLDNTVFMIISSFTHQNNPTMVDTVIFGFLLENINTVIRNSIRKVYMILCLTTHSYQSPWGQYGYTGTKHPMSAKNSDKHLNVLHFICLVSSSVDWPWFGKSGYFIYCWMP